METFQERNKAGHIYETYFDIYSEHRLDFNLFDTLAFYGVISEEKSEELSKELCDIGEELYNKMSSFDRITITKIK